MTSFFGDDYVTQISNIVLDPSGGQFGPDVTGFTYSEFFGVGEEDLVGDSFSFGGPVIVDIPFVGETTVFTARLFGEIGAQFGLLIESTLDPGSVDAILPYETVVAYPDFDIATINGGDVVDVFFGATFDPTADPDSGFTTEFPRFTFDIGILTEMVVELAAEIGVGSDSDIYKILDFTVPETVLPILSVDTARDITAIEAAENESLNEGDINPIEVFGITTPELVGISGLEPAFNDAGEFAGVGIPLNTFVSSPDTDAAETTDASAESDDGSAPDPDPGFDLTSIDLGKFEIFVPDINTVSKLVEGVFVTDPTMKAEYVYEEDEGGNRLLDENGDEILLDILRLEDLDADGNNLGEGNRDDLVRLTLDLDGLITYASGGTFPPLELGPLDLLDGGISLGGPLGTLSLDAGFSYNLLDVELEAALPLEQEFTLTPRLQTQLQFFESDGAGGKVDIAKEVEIIAEQKVLRFNEAGIFQDETITARLRELAASNSTFAQDVDLLLDLDEGITGAFTGQTASLGGRMIISRDGGATWELLFTNGSDPIAESAPALGQDQTGDLTLDENTLLGYRLFIGSGSLEVTEDYVIEFDETDSVYVEDIQTTSAFLTETPFLDDLNTLNIVYDDQETFVEIVSKAVPIVTNRTGLEFDLALLLSGLAASATFEASYDIGPVTIGAGLEFDLGPLFEEKFELLNVDIVDLFNDSFQIEDTETTTFVLGAPAPETDFGDAIVGTTGNDTLQGTPEADEIVAFTGNDTINALGGDDLIFISDGGDSVDGGEGSDLLDISEYDGVTSTAPVNFGTGNLPVGTRLGAVLFYNNFDRLALLDATGGSGDDVAFAGIERFRLTDRADLALLGGAVIGGATGPDLDFFDASGGNDTVELFDTAIPEVLLGDGDDTLRLISTIPDATGPTFSGLADGGDGQDTILVRADADLGSSNIQGLDVTGFENLLAEDTGGASATFLAGDENANTLTSETSTDITLDGRGGSDLLEGGEGNDLLIGGNGPDVLYGGDGLDTADYSDADTSVFIDLSFDGTGRGFRGDAQGDVLEGIEQVIGSDFDDILIGSDAALVGLPPRVENLANTLVGGLGNDRLMAVDGGDILYGGEGDDLLANTRVTATSGIGNVYNGGEGFDVLALSVRDSFFRTGETSGTARFTYLTGDFFTPDTTTSDRSVTVDVRWRVDTHIEVKLEEDGSGIVTYAEDDAVRNIRATEISGTAIYSHREPRSIVDAFPPYRTKTVSYTNSKDKTLAAVDNDSISFSRDSSLAGNNGSGKVIFEGSPPAASGRQIAGSETFTGIEGIIGSKGDDAIAGNSQDNALYGNGGWDAIVGGAGNDTLGFGEVQTISDAFSFPGGSGGQSAVRIFPTVEARLATMNPEDAGAFIAEGSILGDDVIKGLARGDSGTALAGRINEGSSSGADPRVMGSFLWGGQGEDTLDMRFDRGLSFFPDVSTNFAIVDLNVASANAPINDFTGEQIQYGRAEWRNSSGSLQSFAATFGVENVIGSRQGDTITGDRNDNVIEGLDGADLLNGDLGFDTASYALAEEGVTLNFRAEGAGFVLDNARATITGTGDATGDFARNFEKYVGSDHDDIAIIEGAALDILQVFAVPYQFTEIVEVNPFVTEEITVTTTENVSYPSLSTANDSIGLEIDLGEGADQLVIEGRGAHTVSLGDGEDTATLKGLGHAIDAGSGNDVMTVEDLDDLSLREVAASERITTIDGGDGEDTVIFNGGAYDFLFVDDNAAFVIEVTDPKLTPEQVIIVNDAGQQVIDLTEQQLFEDRQNQIDAAFASYQLENVEIVEINGERIRLNNDDPIVDPDVTLFVGEDQIDTYDLGLNITDDDIANGATFEILSVPQTAELIFEGGQPLVAGDIVSAANMAALKVFPGQNFDPAIDTVSFLRVGDPVEDVQTKILPPTINGTALNITAHLTEVTTVIKEPVTPDPEIALVRLNPAPLVGGNPPVADIEYLDGGVFDPMPSGSTTVEFLFRSAGEFDPNGPDYSFVSYSGGGNNNALTMFGFTDGRGLALGFNGRSVQTGYRIDQLFDREVHRVSAVFDTDNNKIELYVDGIRVFEQRTGVDAGLANNGYLVFGQEQDSFGGRFDSNQVVKGDMGDIRIWDGALSEAEINAFAFTEIEDPSAETNLNAYWKADPANEGVMINQVGDRHLAIINRPEIVTVDEPTPPNDTVVPTVRVNIGAITDEYIEIDNTPMPTGDMTLEFVMQGLDLQNEFGVRQHFASYAVTGSNNEFLMFVDGTNLKGTIGMGVSGNPGFDTGVSSSLIMDGEPHRISVTLDVANQIVTLYIDGVEVFSGNGNGPLALQTGGTFNFGQEQDSVGGNFDPNQIVRADFGDIRLWNDIRTPEEIAANAFIQIGNPAAEQGLVANWQVDPANNTTIPDLVGGTPMRQEATPVRGSVQFDLPEAPPGPIFLGPPVEAPQTITEFVDQQGDPVTITVDEVPTNGTVFYMAPDPTLLALGISFDVEVPVAVGDELTPAQLEGLFFRGDENFTGPAGAFRYTVEDDVSFRDLAGTPFPDRDNSADATETDGIASQTITFEVTPANDAPEISRVLFPISPGAVLENDLRSADAEGDEFQVALTQAPTLGTVEVKPDGSFIYRQNEALDFEGKAFLEDRFSVQATETVPAEASLLLPPAQSAEQEQVIRIINPAFQSAIIFDPDNPDFFDEDGNPIKLGGLGTNDVILGHAGPDGLFGFGGNDSLTGLAGNDTLDGGLGDDSLEGGEGVDTLSYGSLSKPGGLFPGIGVLVDLSKQGDPQNTGAGRDTFTGFENLEGSDFADLLTGDENANTILGGGGRDNIRGGGGDDVLYGGEGFDVVAGGEGADSVSGGNEFADLLSYARIEQDLVFDLRTPFRNPDGSVNPANESSAPILEDFIANDFEGYAGANNFENTFIADGFAKRLFLAGGQFDDTFFGGANNDTFVAGRGNDLMYGNEGRDALRGGDGDDDYFGGSGADFFFFEAFSNFEGNDTVHDFEVGADEIRFVGNGVQSLEDLEFSSIDVGGDAATADTLITFEVGGANYTITILDATIADVEDRIVF